jgi:hypothetical protein
MEREQNAGIFVVCESLPWTVEIAPFSVACQLRISMEIQVN